MSQPIVPPPQQHDDHQVQVIVDIVPVSQQHQLEEDTTSPPQQGHHSTFTSNNHIGSQSKLLPIRVMYAIANRLADILTSLIGSWKMILFLTCFLLFWLLWNLICGTIVPGFARASWDPYPFVFLNLLLSFEAAYTAPIIMMSQNRAAQREEGREHSLHWKLDQLRGKEVVSVIEALVQQNNLLLNLKEQCYDKKKVQANSTTN